VVEPTDVKLEDNLIKIYWSDGHESVYPNKLLRDSCPCAACRGEFLLFGKGYKPERPNAPEDIRPLRFAQVGAYALNIAWSDGHASGIYTFKELRELCQCSQCRASA